MNISEEEIKHLAELSKIELSEEEVGEYKREANEIVAFFDTLKESRSGEEVVEVSKNVFTDGEQVCKKTGEEVKQFTNREGDYLKVPKVFE